MKTKKEWIQTDNVALSILLQAMIAEIQKDTLLHAAAICHNHTNNACESGFASQYDCESSILAEIDKI